MVSFVSIVNLLEIRKLAAGCYSCDHKASLTCPLARQPRGGLYPPWAEREASKSFCSAQTLEPISRTDAIPGCHLTFHFLQHLQQEAAFFQDPLLDASFSHPEVAQNLDGEPSEDFPAFSIGEGDAWGEEEGWQTQLPVLLEPQPR